MVTRRDIFKNNQITLFPFFTLPKTGVNFYAVVIPKTDDIFGY